MARRKIVPKKREQTCRLAVEIEKKLQEIHDEVHAFRIDLERYQHKVREALLA